MLVRGKFEIEFVCVIDAADDDVASSTVAASRHRRSPPYILPWHTLLRLAFACLSYLRLASPSLYLPCLASLPR